MERLTKVSLKLRMMRGDADAGEIALTIAGKTFNYTTVDASTGTNDGTARNKLVDSWFTDDNAKATLVAGSIAAGTDG